MDFGYGCSIQWWNYKRGGCVAWPVCLESVNGSKVWVWCKLQSFEFVPVSLVSSKCPQESLLCFRWNQHYPSKDWNHGSHCRVCMRVQFPHWLSLNESSNVSSAVRDTSKLLCSQTHKFSVGRRRAGTDFWDDYYGPIVTNLYGINT